MLFYELNRLIANKKTNNSAGKIFGKRIFFRETFDLFHWYTSGLENNRLWAAIGEMIVRGTELKRKLHRIAKDIQKAKNRTWRAI